MSSAFKLLVALFLLCGLSSVALAETTDVVRHPVRPTNNKFVEGKLQTADEMAEIVNNLR